MGTFDFWLNKIGRLKVDRARGDPAPHKPLLLLVVLEMAEMGQLSKDILPLSPELAFRFFTYWSIVSHRRKQRPDIRLPFYHLKSDGFWSPLDERGMTSPDRHLTRFAKLPSDFILFANDPASREQARRILIAKYFEPNERIALYTLIGLPVLSQEGKRRDASYLSQQEAKETGREARFRLNIVAAYNYTCALTGYRLTTITAGSIVDAAHIHQFANSRNNDLHNGIALCKNAHWLFDQGLWSIADDYRVIVAVGKFSESNPDGRDLQDYHGKLLRLPADQALWPSPIHLAWHRKNKFQGV